MGGYKLIQPDIHLLLLLVSRPVFGVLDIGLG